jgi:hypothetical protein
VTRKAPAGNDNMVERLVMAVIVTETSSQTSRLNTVCMCGRLGRIRATFTTQLNIAVTASWAIETLVSRDYLPTCPGDVVYTLTKILSRLELATFACHGGTL